MLLPLPLLHCTAQGGIVQLGEAGVVAVEMVWCDAGTQGLWLLGPLQADGKLPGYVLMVLFVVVLVFPWCFLKSMKQLEYAGAVGYPLVSEWVWIDSVLIDFAVAYWRTLAMYSVQPCT